ncbi:MAG: hypothetical protein KGJ86_16720, partial [Chloroflexota bacterium]|nr:hypothetical protein [Chloroflexota bacterium]
GAGVLACPGPKAPLLLAGHSCRAERELRSRRGLEARATVRSRPWLEARATAGCRRWPYRTKGRIALMKAGKSRGAGVLACPGPKAPLLLAGRSCRAVRELRSRHGLEARATVRSRPWLEARATGQLPPLAPTGQRAGSPS